MVNGISHQKHIMEYVARQRKIGIEAWVKEQEEINGCPVCGTLMIWCEETCRKCEYKREAI